MFDPREQRNNCKKPRTREPCLIPDHIFQRQLNDNMQHNARGQKDKSQTTAHTLQCQPVSTVDANSNKTHTGREHTREPEKLPCLAKVRRRKTVPTKLLCMTCASNITEEHQQTYHTHSQYFGFYSLHVRRLSKITSPSLPAGQDLVHATDLLCTRRVVYFHHAIDYTVRRC